MSIDLSAYRAIEIGNFVTITGPSETYRFSDMNRVVTFGGSSFTNLGSLMSISEFYSDLRALEQTVNVGISGVPGTNISDFLSEDIKGSTIEIARGYYDPVTQAEIAGGSGATFRGLIMTWGMTEEWDSDTRTSTFMISFECNSEISLLLNKVSGRRTNDDDQRALYPGDLSMSRVATITNATFQFGKPDQGTNR